MTVLLQLLIFKSPLAWLLMGASLLALLGLPRLLGLRTMNGMINAQITLFFNVLVMVGGMDAGLIDAGRMTHFFVLEFGFLLAVLLLYRWVLRYRTSVMSALRRFFSGNGAYVLVAFMGALTVFNFVEAPSDGSSRIEYMTEAWFSLLKPAIQIATPLSYLGVFVLLLDPARKWLGYLLLVLAILSNIATGSKASFLLALFFAYLAIRDLTAGQKISLSRLERVVIVGVAALAGVVALSHLAVDASDVLDRFFLYGEANILTYFSPDPTAACSNVSLFASMHRGLARFLGDPSARDLDTLFGFALMIQEVGANTLTGPNARLSAYFACNFPDGKVVFGLAVVALYLLLMRTTFKTALRRPLAIALVYPFVLSSLFGASQDFLSIMQDITIMTGLLIAFGIAAIATPHASRRRHA